jgi:hypothetical protein
MLRWTVDWPIRHSVRADEAAVAKGMFGLSMLRWTVDWPIRHSVRADVVFSCKWFIGMFPFHVK